MRIFLSYGQVNKAEAEIAFDSISSDPAFEVTREPIDRSNKSPKAFMDSVRGHDAVIHLISLDYLCSRNCMTEIAEVMAHSDERNYYRERTVPVLIRQPEDAIDLSTPSAHLQLVDYWMTQKRDLEEQLESGDPDLRPSSALEELRGDLTVIRDIGEHILRFMRTITSNTYEAAFADQVTKSFDDVIRHLREINGGQHESPPKSRAKQLRDPRRWLGALSHASFDDSSDNGEVAHLIELRNSIVVASEDDPLRPEFPPFSPRFPATPVRRLAVPELDREILVKDESYNFTGSHKDRMAWEIVVYYKTVIEDLLAPRSKQRPLPSASIISNGSAAIAIQVMLRCYGLPPLKVLVDERTDRRILRKLEGAGCEVFPHDLADRELDSGEVLRLTDNADGFDVTARNLVDPNRRTYYDWLAYEILNCGARHIFIPVGTGDLFVNVLTILRDELTGVINDKRLTGGLRMIEGLEIYGATSEDRKTKMDKLYAPFRPTLSEARRVVSEMRDAGHCGWHSRVYDVDEGVVAGAMATARAGGVQCDESGIAGLSLLLQVSADREIPDSEEILVVNTGWLHL